MSLIDFLLTVLVPSIFHVGSYASWSSSSSVLISVWTFVVTVGSLVVLIRIFPWYCPACETSPLANDQYTPQ